MCTAFSPLLTAFSLNDFNSYLKAIYFIYAEMAIPITLQMIISQAILLETVSQSLLVIASDQRERGNPPNFDALGEKCDS